MKWLLGAALAATYVGVAPSAAMAQGKPRSYESPQHFAAELRVGLYNPKVDSEPGLAGTPFEDAFGPNGRLYLGAEFDWQILRIPYFGTLGPGLGVGYVNFTRPARLPNGAPSAQETSFQIAPFRLVGVLRVDVLARELSIPVVPYLKAGGGLALWRMSSANGTTRVGDAVGKGYTYGAELSFGAALLLDVFDEYAAKQADLALGINNTYLYGEYQMSMLDNFGASDALRVGANMLVFGLAFEF